MTQIIPLKEEKATRIWTDFKMEEKSLIFTPKEQRGKENERRWCQPRVSHFFPPKIQAGAPKCAHYLILRVFQCILVS